MVQFIGLLAKPWTGGQGEPATKKCEGGGAIHHLALQTASQKRARIKSDLEGRRRERVRDCLIS